MKKKFLRKIFGSLLIIAIVYSLGQVILIHLSDYTAPYYTEAVYKNLEDIFNRSQYRQKNPTALIPDETVFSYAAGAYLRGIDPILINSEHTPLGKYILALCILWFKNDKLAVPVFGVFSILAVWLVAKNTLHDSVMALIPVLLFAVEPLFINQFQYTPLLDIIQLPFIYLSIYCFTREFGKNYYWLTGICLGFVMATKTIVPGVLLLGVFIGTLLLYKKFKSILGLYVSLIVAVGVFLLSYSKTFIDGYSMKDFIGFQKWIFLYQKSRLLYPFSVWKLIYLNRWQTWWGDFSELHAQDWTFAWPLLFTLGFITMAHTVIKRKTISPGLVIIVLWVAIYELFLSLGVVTTRFFLPLLPALYIIGTYLVLQAARRWSFLSSRGSSIKKRRI